MITAINFGSLRSCLLSARLMAAAQVAYQIFPDIIYLYILIIVYRMLYSS
jgi:hypothetical protein